MVMAQEKNPYDFIMNPGQKPKLKLPAFLSGNNKKQRIIIVAAGSVFLIIIMMMLFSFIFRNNNGPQTLKLVQQHTELLRISDLGKRDARGSDAKNLASTIKLTLQSTEDQIVAIAKKDQKIGAKEISGGKNTKTEQTLTEAKQNNRFDEVFTETIYVQIRTYLTQIKVVYDASSSNNDKKTLNDLHTQLSKLLPAPGNQLNQ